MDKIQPLARLLVPSQQASRIYPGIAISAPLALALQPSPSVPQSSLGPACPAGHPPLVGPPFWARDSKAPSTRRRSHSVRQSSRICVSLSQRSRSHAGHYGAGGPAIYETDTVVVVSYGGAGLVEANGGVEFGENADTEDALFRGSQMG